MIVAAKKKPEVSELDKIKALADEIKRHQDPMWELIGGEAAKDKAAHPALPLVMLEQDICKYGLCPCDVMLHRLQKNAEAALLNERSGNG